MLRPLPDAVAESTYQTVISTLGLQDSTTADRMAALSSLSASELLAQLPLGLPFLPREDGETVKDVVTFQDLELHVAVRAPRCATLLIGSCDMDVRRLLIKSTLTSPLPLTQMLARPAYSVLCLRPNRSAVLDGSLRSLRTSCQNMHLKCSKHTT